MSSESRDISPQQLSRWQQLRQKRWFRWAGDLAIFALIFTGITMWQSRTLVKSGAPAPQFALVDMQGNEHQLQQYQGKKTLLVFWAPWCGVCGAESDNVSRIKSWMGERINLISVVLDYQSDKKIQEFMDKQDVDYPVLKGNRMVQQDYKISSYPTLYVLNEDGNIDYTVVGYTTTLGMLWRALL